MTIPTSVYETAKVAEDFSASKKTVDSTAAIRGGMQSGKGFFKQLWEYYRITRGPGRLDLKDYYLYKLYDDARYTFARKQEFVSERFYFEIVEKCCDPRWWILADDKFWSYTVLRANGFPVPETQAVYCPGARVFGGAATLTNSQQLARFFEGQAAFPVYAKPVNGIGSFGNFLVEKYEDSTLYLHDGTQMPLAQFVNEIDATNGQLLQSTLTSHPELADVCGRVSTVRVILIFRNGEPKILHTVWKVPATRNMADNFWRDGNRLAAIDSDSGVVLRVIGHEEGVPQELDSHTPAAAELLGRTLPDWDAVIDLCVRGARLFSPLKFQSWDIALTDDGPVVVEFNPGSAFNLSQLATGRGFLTDEFLEFLGECGCTLKKRAPAAERN
jgi:Sugar-transfer associated ATP-grasp